MGTVLEVYSSRKTRAKLFVCQKPFSLLSFICLCICSCTNRADDRHAGNTNLSVESSVLISDSVNSIPLFVDDGDIERMYTSKGIFFGSDIVKASQSGDTDAQFILAQMYTYGICGAKANRQKAFKLYLSLADNEVAAAQAMAGYMMFYGFGTSEDTTQGLQLIANAANNDYWLAFFMLGNIYMYNLDQTVENVEYAKICFATAAQHGICAAQTVLNQIEKRIPND